MWLDVTLPRTARVPGVLVHRFTVRSTFPDGTTRTFRFRAASTRVDRRAPVRLAPPLRGGRYVVFNGCCVHSDHRNAITAQDGTPYISQRYAADFIRVDAHGVAAEGDLTQNASFFTYGRPVRAVADAKVVYTLDTVPENVPFNEPPGSAFTTRTIVGNQVVLKLGPRRYVTYSHLQTGSVAVRVGHRVHRGDVIGRVGNTGQAGAAHLHLQVSDGPIPLASNPVPFVFGSFRLSGEIDNLPAFLTGQAPAHVVTAHSGRRHGEMPLQDAVVAFGR
jgi:hypothetical protein